MDKNLIFASVHGLLHNSLDSGDDKVGAFAVILNFLRYLEFEFVVVGHAVLANEFSAISGY